MAIEEVDEGMTLLTVIVKTVRAKGGISETIEALPVRKGRRKIIVEINYRR